MPFSATCIPGMFTADEVKPAPPVSKSAEATPDPPKAKTSTAIEKRSESTSRASYQRSGGTSSYSSGRRGAAATRGRGFDSRPGNWFGVQKVRADAEVGDGDMMASYKRKAEYEPEPFVNDGGDYNYVPQKIKKDPWRRRGSAKASGPPVGRIGFETACLNIINSASSDSTSNLKVDESGNISSSTPPVLVSRGVGWFGDRVECDPTKMGSSVGGLGFSKKGAAPMNLVKPVDELPTKMMLILRRVGRSREMQVSDVVDLKAVLLAAIESNGNVDGIVNVYQDSLDQSTLSLIFDEAIQAKVLAFSQRHGNKSLLRSQRQHRGAFGLLATPQTSTSMSLGAPPEGPGASSVVRGSGGPAASQLANSAPSEQVIGWPSWFHPGRSYLFDPSGIVETLSETFLETVAKGAAEQNLNDEDMRYIREYFFQYIEFQKCNPFPILALVTFYLTSDMLDALFENHRMATLFLKCSKKWELKPAEYEAVSTGALYPVTKPNKLKLHIMQATIGYLKWIIRQDQMDDKPHPGEVHKPAKAEPSDYALHEIPGVVVQPDGSAAMTQRVRKWICSVLYVLSRKNQPNDKFIEKMKHLFGRYQVEEFLNRPGIKRAMENATKNLVMESEATKAAVGSADVAVEGELKRPLSRKAIKAQLAVTKLEANLDELKKLATEEDEKPLPEMENPLVESLLSGLGNKSAAGENNSSVLPNKISSVPKLDGEFRPMSQNFSGTPENMPVGSGAGMTSDVHFNEQFNDETFNDLNNGGFNEQFNQCQFANNFSDSFGNFYGPQCGLEGPMVQQGGGGPRALFPLMGGGGPGTCRPPIMPTPPDMSGMQNPNHMAPMLPSPGGQFFPPQMGPNMDFQFMGPPGPPGPNMMPNHQNFGNMNRMRGWGRGGPSDSSWRRFGRAGPRFGPRR